VISSAVHVGSGFCEKDGGYYIVPSQEALDIFHKYQIETHTSELEKELTGTLGASVLAAVVNEFSSMPEMDIEKIGYGAGGEDYELPNLMRAVLGSVTGEDFEKMFARKGVQKVSLKSAQIYDFEKGSPLIPKNDKYSRYEWAENEWRLKGDLRNRCWKHWSSMVITSAGDMVPCCFDKNAAHAFGNIESGSLLKIWKSKAAQHFRKAVLRHRKDIDICRNCSEV
jgi:radical SAM protein with 4Fe4S-binding SPASM domain